ncbi:MAG: hypothetical protein KDI68_06760 [Gammaproteobacteria bacterium]|nr:hypothetical protein [Gammaproteobacteria bacterium]
MPPRQAAADDGVASAVPVRREAGSRGTGDRVDPVTTAELREIDQLQARDRQVRAHEQAHLAAAAGIATSGASFSYRLGPDGKRYATAGEVGIDTAPVAGDPQATLLKAEQIRRAALAPADPSAQDQQVAAAAAQMAMRARAELQQQAAQAYRSNASEEQSDRRHTAVFNQFA